MRNERLDDFSDRQIVRVEVVEKESVQVNQVSFHVERRPPAEPLVGRDL